MQKLRERIVEFFNDIFTLPVYGVRGILDLYGIRYVWQVASICERDNEKTWPGKGGECIPNLPMFPIICECIPTAGNSHVWSGRSCSKFRSLSHASSPQKPNQAFAAKVDFPSGQFYDFTVPRRKRKHNRRGQFGFPKDFQAGSSLSRLSNQPSHPDALLIRSLWSPNPNTPVYFYI